MRVLFLVWGQSSHWFQLVPAAWAFRAAGHEVRVAGQSRATAAVLGSGLPMIPVGGGYDFTADVRDAIYAHPVTWAEIRAAEQSYTRTWDRIRSAADADPLHRRLLTRTLARATHARVMPFVTVAEAVIDELARVVRAWRPDLVVADPLMLAGPLVAHLAGVPLVRHLWGPDLNRRPGAAMPGNGLPTELWPAELLVLYERFGVPPEPEAAAATIDACPDSLQWASVPGRLAARFVPYNGAGRVPAWTLEPPSRPRVCVCWGTLTTEMTGSAGFVVPTVLETLRRLDVETVVAVTPQDRALLGPEPPHTRFVENLPLHAVLPGCAAIVHQGGSGTMLTAVAHGVPQLVVARTNDQVIHGELARAAGIGASLAAAEAGPDAITGAMSAILTEPAVAAATKRVRAENDAAPPAADLVSTLCALAREHRD